MKIISQTTAKMTIALVTTCMFFAAPGQAESTCIITSRHLAYLGNKTDEFLQSIEETANPFEVVQSIRLNETVYDSEDILDFITAVSENENNEFTAATRSELESMLSSVSQFDYANNVLFLCNGENFDSSTRVHRISSFLEHFLFSEVITKFYMDEYYNK